MTGFDRKRIDEIKARLSKNTSGEAALLWKSPLAKIVLEDVEFLLGLVEHLRARAGECDVDPEVAKLTGRVRLLEGDVSNLKTAVDELRRADLAAPFSPENKRLGGHPPVSFEPAPWEK